MSKGEQNEEQCLETCQVIQIRQLCGRAILSYKIHQVISLAIITTNILVRRNEIRNKEEQKVRLLVVAHDAMRAMRCVSHNCEEFKCILSLFNEERSIDSKSKYKVTPNLDHFDINSWL